MARRKAFTAARTTSPFRRLLVVLLAGFVFSGCRAAPEKTRLVLAATTSLDDTGLLDHLAGEFNKAHPDIILAPVAVGTGQAIVIARRGDADVLISHDSVAEVQLVLDGVATERRSLMYNDFVIAGPAQDPAQARGMDALAALKAIHRAKTAFVSRGDDSGTHRRELKILREGAIDPTKNPSYIEAAVGMGDALLLAAQKRAYILTDRGTYLRFRERVNLDVIVEGDARLLNSYAVTVLKGPRAREAEWFANWLTSSDVQRLIGAFGRQEYGTSLFVPSAHGAALHDTIPTGERSE